MMDSDIKKIGKWNFRYKAASGLPDAKLLLAFTAVDPLVEAGKALVDDIVGSAVTADVRTKVKLYSPADRLEVGNHARDR